MSNRVFYHGTQTAVHQTDKPYLDPRYGKGGDEGDPDKPHVFVTPNKTWAKLYALKASNMISNGMDNGVPVAIYLGNPKGVQGGWLYQCPEDTQKPFEETIAQGRGTGMYVSYDPVQIAQAEKVPNLEHVMQQDRLQAFCLNKNMDVTAWLEASRDAASNGKQAEFLQQQIKVENLIHLNAQMGIAPHPSYAVDQTITTAQSPQLQPALNNGINYRNDHAARYLAGKRTGGHSQNL